MARLTAFLVLTAAFLATGSPADAQSRRQERLDRREVARAQGVPPGQLPPASQCRVWYDDRPNGRQPAPTSCSRAESIAARDRNARVVYGEDAYADARIWRDGRYGGRYPDTGRDNDRAVPRGSVRDPRLSGGTLDSTDRYGRQGGSVGFRNGYRDGLTKGREDAEDGDAYDVNRHSWYRSATRGYENEHGTRYEYIDRYRAGFEDGYAEGYRVYRRR
jgi:hypothetical protein